MSKKIYILIYILIYISLSSPQEIMRINEIKPNMEGVVKTVFEGDRIEDIKVKVLGIMKNALGPKQDIILVRLEGDRIKELGIASGMSGSPVYINNKLIGALSLRYGVFQKECIGGVTPIENIIEVEAKTKKQSTHPSSLTTHHLLTIISSPLILSGFNQEIIKEYDNLFQEYNLIAIQGSGEIQTEKETQKELTAGDAIALQLIRGDISASVIGTLTYVEKEKIFALGHSLFNLGKVEIPLSQAIVLTTMPSQLASFKISAPTREIGSIVEDRITGVYGIIGKETNMLPISIKINNVNYNYEIFRNDYWIPLLLSLSLASVIKNSADYSDEAVIKLKGRIELENKKLISVEDFYCGDNLTPLYIQVTNDINNIFTQILMNEFEKAQIKNINLQLDIEEEQRIATIDDVWVDKNEVKPGDKINIKIFLKPYRGKKFIKSIELLIPENIPSDKLQILVTGGNNLNQLDKKLPQNLDQLIEVINERRKNNNIYVKLLKNISSVTLHNKVMPSLPLSILSILSAEASKSSFIMPTSDILEKEIPTSYFIIGSKKLEILVK